MQDQERLADLSQFHEMVSPARNLVNLDGTGHETNLVQMFSGQVRVGRSVDQVFRVDLNRCLAMELQEWNQVNQDGTGLETNLHLMSRDPCVHTQLNHTVHQGQPSQ